MNVLNLIGRKERLFDTDIHNNELKITALLKNCKILVIGGAGTIGSAVTLEIFKRNPKSLHVIDISENNLVELVRDIRSSMGYSSGDFKHAIDCGGPILTLMESEGLMIVSLIFLLLSMLGGKILSH